MYPWKNIYRFPRQRRRSRTMLSPSGIGLLHLKRALFPKKGLSKNEHFFFFLQSSKRMFLKSKQNIKKSISGSGEYRVRMSNLFQEEIYPLLSRKHSWHEKLCLGYMRPHIHIHAWRWTNIQICWQRSKATLCFNSVSVTQMRRA